MNVERVNKVENYYNSENRSNNNNQYNILSYCRLNFNLGLYRYKNT